ncbi:hypothetical protein BKA70DRAFT_1569873 [Coprinopsis sp. MPI-PUGE-AT-0042]|nr:hypothetical protein BKA70DRAFT_1569873 [Coprinopsis sp. MPI-PUGE-AT-0042]
MAHYYHGTEEPQAQGVNLTPISTLSTELLCRIFMECLGKWPKRPGTYVTWLAVTHVCHLWRCVAMENPRLWCRISPRLGRRWMNIFVLRSKEVALSIRAFKHRDGSLRTKERQFLSDMLQNHQRLEEIALELRKKEDRCLLGSLVNTMPALTHLTLLNYMPEVTALPSPFLGNDAPRVQLLSLDNLDLPWSSPILEGITSISVHNTERRIPGIPHPSFNTFFSALETMPELTKLSIEYALPITAPPNSRIAAIPLPRLETLKLFGTCDQCRLVMQHIQIPLSARVKLAVLSDVDESNLRALCDALRSSWLGEAPTRATAPQTREMQWERIELRSVGRVTFVKMGAIPELKAFQLEMHQEWTASLQAILMDFLPIQNTRDVSISYESFPPAIAQTTIASLSTIKEAIVTNTACAVGIIQGLLDDPLYVGRMDSSLASLPTQEIYLPRLTGLRLCGVSTLLDASSVDSEALGLRDLEEWLRFRRSAGAGLKRLELPCCHFLTLDAVESLRSCLADEGTVIWDGPGKLNFNMTLRPMSYD